MCCFFYKQKTAYEMRISDWSSDVCSSDLLIRSIPAFKPEPLMPDPGVYRSSLRFSEGNTSWTAVYASYVKRPSGGGVIEQYPDLQKRVDTLIRSEERRVGKEGVSKCRSRW